jgi:hypothetical protein
MKCIHCKRGLAEGVALFRQNPKGEVGVWACGDCNMTPVDQEIMDVIEAVQGPTSPPTTH